MSANRPRLLFTASLLLLGFTVWAPAQTSDELTRLLSASQKSWFGYSYRFKVEQITEIGAEMVKIQVELAKKEIEGLATSDPDYANKRANLQSRIEALEGAIGTNKEELEIEAVLVSRSKWRIVCRTVQPVIENTTVFLSIPNGGVLEYLNEQKLLRYHESANSVLAGVLRGIPDFIATSHLDALGNDKLETSPANPTRVSFVSNVSSLRYNLTIDPKTFSVTGLEELTGGDKVMRSVVSKGDGAFVSKQFNPDNGYITQEQKWKLEQRTPLGAISEAEFTATIPDGYVLELPEGDHGYKAVPLDGFRDLIFK